MAVFEIKYELGINYNEVVELDIRLKVKPSNEDITNLFKAIETLDKFAKKNLDLKLKPVVKETK